MTINEFRQLFRVSGCPSAKVLFAVNEATGETVGDQAWDDPQPLPFSAPDHPKDRVPRTERAYGRAPPYGRYR